MGNEGNKDISKPGEKEDVLNHYKEIVDFANKEINRVHNIYKLIGWGITILFVFGVGVALYLLGDKFDDIQSSIKLKGEEIESQVGEKVSSRLDDEFKKENIHSLVEEKAKERIGMVADEIISKNIEDKIKPEVLTLTSELDKAKKLSEFLLTVIKSQSDDRMAFEQLEQWADDKSYSFSKEAKNAKEVIRGSYVNFPPFVTIDWQKMNIDPSSLTIPQLYKLYETLPPLLHSDLIIHVWEKIPTVSKKDRIQFLINVLEKEKSLAALTFSGKYLSEEFNLGWNPFVIKHLLNTWEAKKDKY